MVEIEDSEGKQVLIQTLTADLEDLSSYISDLMAAIPNPIYVVNPSGIIVDGNKSLEQLTGWSLEELIGKRQDDLFIEKAAVRRIDKETIENGYVKGEELLLRTSQGGDIPVSIFTKMRIDDSGNKSYVVTLMDITKRKKAEDELKLRAQLLDGATDAIFLADFDGNIIYANETAYRSRGYSREELLRMNFGQMDTSEYAALFEQRAQKLKEKGHVMFESAACCKDKSTIPLEVHASLIESGNRKLILSISRDITERKLAEAEKRELERKAQLASRLASVGEMASGIAHEINNPLSGVIGYTQLLMTRKDIPEDIRKDLEIINEGGQRVVSVMKRMLSFARHNKPERSFVSINDIVAATLELRGYSLETNNIKVTTRFAPDLPVTIADGGQLQQVFLNLIINAEKEMELTHGKGNLSIKTEQIDGAICISFKDNGPGVAEENMERIFEPFFTTREAGNGTGLGLSVCHGIIAEHNGKIYAQRNSSRGATFIVELPVVTSFEQLEPDEPA